MERNRPRPLLRHNTAQGRATKLDVTIGYITDATGQRLHVDEESKNGWTRALRIWIPGARDADRQIIIRYRVANAIRFFYASSKEGALDELYWNVTGNDWTMPIDSVHARVVLPDGIAPYPVAVYTGRVDQSRRMRKIERAGNIVDFTLLRGLYPHEGMTIGVGWPAGHISSRPSKTREQLAAVVQWTPLLIPLLVFFLAWKSWQKRGRDPKDGSYVVRYEPVDGVSPAELGTLVDNSADMDDITATLVDLAVRGFIRIEEVTESHLLGLSKSTDYILHILRKRPEWTSLKPHEQRYIGAEWCHAVRRIRREGVGPQGQVLHQVAEDPGRDLRQPRRERLLPAASRQGEGKMDRLSVLTMVVLVGATGACREDPVRDVLPFALIFAPCRARSSCSRSRRSCPPAPSPAPAPAKPHSASRNSSSGWRASAIRR